MTTRTGTQAIGELGRYFSSGFKAKVANEYVARLLRENFTDHDISEGVERVINTRIQRTFPAFAEVRGRAVEAKTERLRAERVQERQTEARPVPIDPEELERGLAECREFRKSIFGKRLFRRRPS